MSTTEPYQVETTWLVKLHLRSSANGYPYPEVLEQALQQQLSRGLLVEPDNQVILEIQVVAGDRFECEICGDLHVDSLHGEALFFLDHGHNTPEGNLGDQIAGLDNLIHVEDSTLDELQAEFTVDFQKYKLDPPMEELEIDWQWYDMKMNEVAEKHGFVIHNNSDSGVWAIYKVVRSLI